jgi:hypothetical protein
VENLLTAGGLVDGSKSRSENQRCPLCIQQLGNPAQKLTGDFPMHSEITTGTLERDGESHRVEIELVVNPPSPTALGSWHGQARLTGGGILLPGEGRLRLADGRSGDVIVTNVVTGSFTESVTFVGSGPLA